jgi:hypothetical protein
MENSDLPFSWASDKIRRRSAAAETLPDGLLLLAVLWPLLDREPRGWPPASAADMSGPPPLPRSRGPLVTLRRGERRGPVVAEEFAVSRLLLLDLSTFKKGSGHRLNMELDLQSIFELCMYSCTHRLRCRNPTPPPRHLGLYTKALLVSQD